MSDVELEELSARLGEVTIVDVRQTYEYDGSFGAPCDPRQGHLPGAVNLNVDDLAGMSAEDVAAQLGVEPGAEIVVYCHSGSRSARAAMSCSGSASRAGTTPARGTSGRRPTCRSRP